MRSALLVGIVAILFTSRLAGQQPSTSAPDFPVGAILRVHLQSPDVPEVQGTITGRRDADGCLVLRIDRTRNPNVLEVAVLVAGITQTELRPPAADTTWREVPLGAYGRNNIACLAFIAG
jgi:hypothetical protein